MRGIYDLPILRPKGVRVLTVGVSIYAGRKSKSVESPWGIRVGPRNAHFGLTSFNPYWLQRPETWTTEAGKLPGHPRSRNYGNCCQAILWPMPMDQARRSRTLSSCLISIFLFPLRQEDLLSAIHLRHFPNPDQLPAVLFQVQTNQKWEQLPSTTPAPTNLSIGSVGPTSIQPNPAKRGLARLKSLATPSGKTPIVLNPAMNTKSSPLPGTCCGSAKLGYKSTTMDSAIAPVCF